MQQSSIVIVGLGRIGSEFLEHFLGLSNVGISIIGVVEPLDTLGRRKAESAGIACLSLEQVVAFGEDVDFIFDFTDSPNLRKSIMQQLADADNHHTEVTSEKTLGMMWQLMSDEPIPLRLS
jgi:predicted dehydrogenase